MQWITQIKITLIINRVILRYSLNIIFRLSQYFPLNILHNPHYQLSNLLENSLQKQTSGHLSSQKIFILTNINKHLYSCTCYSKIKGPVCFMLTCNRRLCCHSTWCYTFFDFSLCNSGFDFSLCNKV